MIAADLAKKILPSVGLRNILAHEYGSVDLDVVAGSLPTARQAYGEYVSQVRRYLLDQPRWQPLIQMAWGWTSG